MEYGFIVIKNNDYSSLFFIHNVNDRYVTLIPSYEPNTKIKDVKENYTIVYKPKLRGVCELNNLHLNNHVVFKYSDATEREGKIVKKKNDLIHVQFFKEPSKPIEVFDFDYKGIPPNLLNIQKIQTKETQQEKVKEVVTYVESENSPEDVYYYSIEQQVNQWLEDMTKHIDLKDQHLLDDIHKSITRYIELNKKYYTYENNYLFKKLSDKSMYNTILNGSSIFDFYSQNIKTYYYDDPTFLPKSMDTKLLDKLFTDTDANSAFFHNTDQFVLNSNDTTSDSHYKINKINEANLDNLSIEYSNYKSTYNRETYTNVLLEDIHGEMSVSKYNEQLYTIKTNREFILDGIVIPSISNLIQYMKQSKMNQLIHKINTPTYVKDKYVIGTLEPCIFNGYNQIIKKNKVEFYSFLNRLLPNIRYVLKCLNVKCYNLYDYIKYVSVFDIHELSKKDYDFMNKFVQKNIRDYKKTTVVTEVESITYPTTSFLLKSDESIFTEHFYSSSELFKLSLYENHTLILFDIIKSNLSNQLDIKTGTIKEIMDEFKANAPRDVTMIYDKVYNSMDELKADTKPIFKDITLQNGPITNVSDPYMKSSILLWNTTDKSKFKSLESFELALKVKEVEPPKDWLSKYTITNGMLAYVIDTKKTYVYENDNWKLYVESEFVKGSSEYNTYVNKRINEIVKEESTKQLRLSNEYSDRDYYVMKSNYLNVFNQSVFNKYNQMKRIYSQLYASNGYKPSPYQSIFDQILAIEQAELRKKYIKLFCELYTIEGKDPYWLYCIETNQKLVPLFIKTLAYSTNYNETIQKICFEQGTEQDEYWVDKYSGYTITKRNFNNEEGFTSDGFKVVSREVIQEPMQTSEHEKNIETILNAIGIPLSHVKHIHNEYMKISKQLSKSSLLIYVVIFIYIQCYVDTMEVTKSFHSCRTSFEGYPLSKVESETSGIDYMICVYKVLTNSKKNIEQATFIQLIKNALKFSSKMSYQLTLDKKTKTEPMIYIDWPHFLPRLTEIRIPKIHNDYYKHFYFQQEMNQWMDEIKPTIQLSGNYKKINNYDVTPNEFRRKYEQRTKYYAANLYYYRTITKNNKKFYLSEPTYSLNKIDRILNPNHGNLSEEELKQKYEMGDELMREVRKKLHSHKKLIEPVVKPTEEPKVVEVDIKEFQSKIDDYLSMNSELKLNQLFRKLNYVTKKRVNILKSKDEHDKMVHTILFNVLNELFIQKDKTTYTQPKLRSYLASILKQTDRDKLLNIIRNTYIDYKGVETHMDMQLDFDLKTKIIIYKYYLCELYKQANMDQRAIYEQILQTTTKSLVIKIDTIKKNNEQAKYKEKKEITDKFKELDQESRNVEFMLKQNKLGDWSVGLSKSIYKYDGKEDSADHMEEITEYEEYMDEEE